MDVGRRDPIQKIDSVGVSVLSKLNSISTENFHPDNLETIETVFKFDSPLRYVTFHINSEGDNTLTGKSNQQG